MGGNGGSRGNGNLVRRVDALCDGIRFTETHLQDQLDSIRGRLADPLRVAVTGRVSCGKSTCVNALLASRIAPVGRGETTQIISYFSYADVESVTVVMRTGARAEVYLSADGRLPQRLPYAPADIDHLEVSLPYAPILESATIIDTPGISSVHPDASARTTDALFSQQSRKAAAGADALLFLLQGRADEAEALAAFQSLAGVSGACCANAIGVISQADTLGEIDEPMEAARRIATRLAGEPALRACVAAVVPLLALIAETVETGSLSVDDEAALAALAEESDEILVDDLASADDFRAGASSVTLAAREELIAKLDVYGIRACVRALKRGVHPSDLAAFLYDLSGLATLKSLIAETFTGRADLLKADQALGDLERLTYQSTSEVALMLRSRIEELRLSPAMHRVREMRALGQHAQGRVPGLPDWLVERLVTVTRETTVRGRLGVGIDARPDEVTAAAVEGATVCRTYRNGGAPTVHHRAVVDTLRRSYELMLAECLGGETSAST